MERIATQQSGKRYIGLIDGQPLRNIKGAIRTFKYEMEASRTAYVEMKKREREAQAS